MAWLKEILRVGMTFLALVLLVLVVGRLTVWLTPQEEEEGVAQREAAASEALNRIPDIEELMVKFEQTAESDVHRVAEWTGDASFQQAPMLDSAVADGELPAVADRLPVDPLVVIPPQSNGPYGGEWVRFEPGLPQVGAGMYQGLAHEGLVRWDAFGREVVPNLAKSWTFEDGGRAIVMQLRQGIRWSDGHPFTTEDIRFQLEAILFNQELSPIITPFFQPGGEPAKFTVIDEYTFRLEFAVPHGLFLYHLASGRGQQMTSTPAHYLKQFHPDYAEPEALEQMVRESGRASWMNLFREKLDWRNPESPVLAAWRLTEPPRGQRVVFHRNPYYWKVDPEGRQLPYIDRIICHLVEAQMLTLRTIRGESQMQNRGLQFERLGVYMRNQASGNYEVLTWFRDSANELAMVFNYLHEDPVLRELFLDKRFRVALSLGINRRDISEAGFYGLAEPRQVAPLPTSPFYDPAYAKAYIDYDPEEANRLLDEIGLAKRNAEGIRLRPDGRPLGFVIDTMPGRATLVGLIVRNWQALGINAQLREYSGELYRLRLNAEKFDVRAAEGGFSQMPLIMPTAYVPSDINQPHQGYSFGRWYRTEGRTGALPPPAMLEAQELWREMEQTIDPERQRALFAELLRLNRENLWIIGTVGGIPEMVVKGHGFHNVPQMAMYSFAFRSPSNTAPECYAIGEKEQQPEPLASQ